MSVFGAAEKKEVGRPPDVRRYRPAVRADVPFTPFSDDDKGTSSFLPPPLVELYLLEVYLLRAPPSRNRELARLLYDRTELIETRDPVSHPRGLSNLIR